jgi:hypothetical protein
VIAAVQKATSVTTGLGAEFPSKVERNFRRLMLRFYPIVGLQAMREVRARRREGEKARNRDRGRAGDEQEQGGRR